MTNQNRYDAIDGLRAFLAIGILIMHVLANGNYNMIIYRVLEKLKFIHLFESDMVSYIIAAGAILIGSIVFAKITQLLLLKGQMIIKEYMTRKNKIVRDYRNGKITKDKLDKCSTCDMCSTINDGSSAISKEQLKNKAGEEIVYADIAGQMQKQEAIL